MKRPVIGWKRGKKTIYTLCSCAIVLLSKLFSWLVLSWHCMPLCRHHLNLHQCVYDDGNKILSRVLLKRLKYLYKNAWSMLNRCKNILMTGISQVHPYQIRCNGSGKYSKNSARCVLFIFLYWTRWTILFWCTFNSWVIIAVTRYAVLHYSYQVMHCVINVLSVG